MSGHFHILRWKRISTRSRTLPTTHGFTRNVCSFPSDPYLHLQALKVDVLLPPLLIQVHTINEVLHVGSVLQCQQRPGKLRHFRIGDTFLANLALPRLGIDEALRGRKQDEEEEEEEEEGIIGRKDGVQVTEGTHQWRRWFGRFVPIVLVENTGRILNLVGRNANITFLSSTT